MMEDGKMGTSSVLGEEDTPKVPLFRTQPPSDKVLLCTTCRESARLIGYSRQVVQDYALFRQGRMNRTFLDKSMERLVDHLMEMDKAGG